jgi:hypothetical protein
VHQFPQKFFRIVLPDYSYVIVPRQHLKEMFSAPEDKLSLKVHSAESLALPYTFQRSVGEDDYHTTVVRTELSRRIPELMPEIVDELEAAIADEIPLTDGTASSHRNINMRLDPCLLV